MCWILLCALGVVKMVLGNNGMKRNETRVSVIIILLEVQLLYCVLGFKLVGGVNCPIQALYWSSEQPIL